MIGAFFRKTLTVFNRKNTTRKTEKRKILRVIHGFDIDFITPDRLASLPGLSIYRNENPEGSAYLPYEIKQTPMRPMPARPSHTSLAVANGQPSGLPAFACATPTI
jgi:hypothetical protein